MSSITLVLLSLSGIAYGQLAEGDSHKNSIGMDLVKIKPGSFTMGQGEKAPATKEEWLKRDWDESPAHTVKIAQPYFMGKFEVTNAQYEQFDPTHKEWRNKHGGSARDDEPVTFVTWQQASDFCKWLSKKEGKPYRLPTEAEWEYACRAGTTTTFSTGDTLKPDEANLAPLLPTGKAAAAKVGSYAANAWGLHDMHGNVAEWCNDWYGPYEAGEQTDPVGRADGNARVCRGWSFLRVNFADRTRYARSSNRSGHDPEDANRCTGFRVVLGEMTATKPLPVVRGPSQIDVLRDPPQQFAIASKPTFVNYAKDGNAPVIAPDSWGPVYSQWNHFAAVCVCPNGDVLAAWYTCVSESGRECSQAVSRLRFGSAKWEPVSSFLTIPDVNCHAPVLFCDGKRIYHFFTQSLNGWDEASDSMRYSDDSGATWSKPKIILQRTDKDALSQPCCCIRTKDGTLVLACDGGAGHKDERFLVSADRGVTWKVAAGDLRKAMGGKYVIHPTIFERADGSIITYGRGPHPMPMFVSKDKGETFDVAETKFPGIGTGQKAAVLKLASGAVLLCSIDRTKELVGGGTYAALSLDDGKTWPHIRKVEGATGYMSLAQGLDGMIYLNGTRMGVVKFNEACVKGGQKAP